MGRTAGSGIEIEYVVDGPDSGRPLLLIGGAGAQIVTVPPNLIDLLVGRGYRVIRFDHRDTGLSGWTAGPAPDPMLIMMGRFSGATVAPPPYAVADLAADARAILDAVAVTAAHLVGFSMGGMVAQSLAISHPARVSSLTSIMSTTGDPAVGQPDAAVMMRLNGIAGDDPIEASVETFRLIAGPRFDEEHSRSMAQREAAGGSNPDAIRFHMAAALGAPDRTEALASVDVPTLVVHGRADPVIGVSGGEATAAAIPGADLLVIDDMGHDIPPVFWPEIIDRFEQLLED